MKSIPIAKPEIDDAIYTDLINEFFLTGYGPTERTDKIVKLKWLQEPLGDQQTCSNIYANFDDPETITEKIAGNELFKFVRDGDSGGPVTYFNTTTKRTMLAGIICFTELIRKEEYFPDVHVRLIECYNWIMETNEMKPHKS